jgi:CubicO group peptidase (beta-lactamase class C family)
MLDNSGIVMQTRIRLLLPILAVFALTAADSSGLDAHRLARIPQRMQAFVDKHQIAGAVTLVARHGMVGSLEAVGSQDIESKKPMRPDTIFQVMSMTKPVTAVGVMILQEEGLLSINHPVSQYLPEFKGKTITLRDLLTHTSGLPGAPTGPMKDLYQRLDHTLAEAVTEFAGRPLEFEPGSKWVYSNTGIATLGRIIEVVSGQSYEQFIDARIFRPLGMTDSFFFPPREKIDRIAMVYKYEEPGSLHRSGAGILGGDPAQYRSGSKYPAPEFGLYSTASDLCRFYQMMLNRGALDGRRILSPASVETMTRNHTGSIHAGWMPGSGFGLGWEVVREPQGTLNLMSPRAFHHGGAFGTFGWIDPQRDLIGIYLVQRENGPSDARDAFIAMANAAVE